VRIARAAFGVWSRQTARIDAFWSEVLAGRARDGTTGLNQRGARRSGKGITILGYGNGTWGGGRSPQKRIRESADRTFGRARVITIDEFMTTATCHVCGDRQQGIVDHHKNYLRGSPAGALDRGIKRCARSSCSTFHDRDVNVRARARARATAPHDTSRELTPRAPPTPARYPGAGGSQHREGTPRAAARRGAADTSAARLRPRTGSEFIQDGKARDVQYAARGLRCPLPDRA
jgi:hypothetical protein